MENALIIALAVIALGVVFHFLGYCLAAAIDKFCKMIIDRRNNNGNS